MRKRRWIEEYFCNKFKTNIIRKQSYCNELYDTDRSKKCDNCPYKAISSNKLTQNSPKGFTSLLTLNP